MAETSVLDATTESTTTAAGDWRSGLTGEFAPLAQEKSLESFKGKDWAEVGPHLAKAFTETKKLVGVKATPTPPGTGASPEEVKAWRAALGVPETPEGYTPKLHPMMAHPEWNKEVQAGFLKLFHEEHLPPKTVDRILGAYGDFVAAQVKDQDQIAVSAKGELRSEWGVNYDAFLGSANHGLTRVAQALGVEKADLFEATKGSDPALVAKVFHWMESQFTEHGWVSGEPVTGVTPEMAVTQIAQLQEQLSKVPQDSEQARSLIDQIANVGRALARA